MEWKKYQKNTLQEMRDYVPGEDMTGISVSPRETPVVGGKIARDRQGSFWYVSPEFMIENYKEAFQFDEAANLTKGQKFVEHITRHLAAGQVVVCKICGKSIDEICGT